MPELTGQFISFESWCELLISALSMAALPCLNVPRPALIFTEPEAPVFKWKYLKVIIKLINCYIKFSNLLL